MQVDLHGFAFSGASHHVLKANGLISGPTSSASAARQMPDLKALQMRQVLHALGAIPPRSEDKRSPKQQENMPSHSLFRCSPDLTRLNLG